MRPEAPNTEITSNNFWPEKAVSIKNIYVKII